MKPTTDDPIDFPPLGATAAFHPFEQMANQMQSMPIGPKSMKMVQSAWPTAAASKPTMSQIVAQNQHGAAHVQELSEAGDIMSDNSSESGLSSPKPANCEPIKNITKQFKGWNLNTESTDQISKHNFDSIQNDSSGWCPWSTTNYTQSGVAPSTELGMLVRDDEDEWTNDDDTDKPRLQTPIDFTFDPIPSLAIGAGIWSTTTGGESGW